MFGLLTVQSVGNKSTSIASAIIEGGFDILLLTDTRHTMSEDVALRRCVPPDYSLIDVPRPTANEALVNRGGVTAVISTSLRYKFVPSPSAQPRSSRCVLRLSVLDQRSLYS